MRRKRSPNSASTDHMRSIFSAVLLGAGLVAGAAIAADKPRAAHEVTIKMSQEAFVPAQITVDAGTPITWTNNDTMPHSVTAQDGTFDSGPIQPGKQFKWTPQTAGAIDYHCIFHPSMTAVMTVRKAP